MIRVLAVEHKGVIRKRWDDAKSSLLVLLRGCNPLDAHDAYPLGAKVTHKGKTWVNLTPANVWAPGVYGWA